MICMSLLSFDIGGKQTLSKTDLKESEVRNAKR